MSIFKERILKESSKNEEAARKIQTEEMSKSEFVSIQKRENSLLTTMFPTDLECQNMSHLDIWLWFLNGLQQHNYIPKVQTNQFTTLSATQTKYTWMWRDYSHSLTFQRAWGTSALPRSLGAPSIQIYRLILNLIPNGVYPARQGNPNL